MNKVKVYLTEKLWENFVYSHTKRFLKEKFKKVDQQETLPAGRSDLTFRDANNRLVIVELQMNALDRKHLAQTIEYKMDWEKRGEKDIRMILLCNEIRSKRAQYINEWDRKFNLNLEVISIPKEEVKDIIHKIDPRIEWVETQEEANHNYYYYDKKEVVVFKEKISITKKTDLNKATKYKEDQTFFNNVKRNFKYKNSLIKPFTVHDEKSLKDIKNFKNTINITENLTELIRELDDLQRKENKEIYYPEISTVESILESIEHETTYRKNLYDPYILNHKKLWDENKKNYRKAEIDLIIYTDRYFDRKTFRLYWQPTNWTFKAIYNDENRRKEIVEKYLKQKNEAIKIEEKKLGRKLSTDWGGELYKYDDNVGYWNMDVIREKNSELNKIKEWIPESDFIFNSRYSEWFKSNKSDFLILEIKNAFAGYPHIRNGRLQNYWGRIGVSILGLISKIYNDLSQNFKVNIHGSLEFNIDELTEDERLLLPSHKQSEKSVYNYTIADSTNIMGPQFGFHDKDNLI